MAQPMPNEDPRLDFFPDPSTSPLPDEHAASNDADKSDNVASDLDPLLFVNTQKIRKLSFVCRCEGCAVEHSFKHSGSSYLSPENIAEYEKALNTRRRAVCPKRKFWPANSAYQVAWMDNWRRLVAIADGLVDFNCEAVWAMVDELQPQPHGDWLPTRANREAAAKAALKKMTRI